MKHALVYASVAAIRTFAQNMSGALGAIVIANTAWPDFQHLGLLATTLTLGALVGALTAFFQNLAEQLKLVLEEMR